MKIVSPLLNHLPDTFSYSIIFMQRPLEALIASQNAMLQHRGETPGAADAETLQAFEKHLTQITAWLETHFPDDGAAGSELPDHLVELP